MKKNILSLSLVVLSIVSIQAQKKKDLLAEIDKLRSELNQTKGELAESQKNEKTSLAEVKLMEAQVKDLKENNESMLEQMSGLTKMSNKKAQNMETSLNAIKAKDKQLKTINDALTKSDSMKLAVLTVFKQGLGSDAPIAFKNGEIFITLPNNMLFGTDDKSTKIQEKGKAVLAKIAKTLNKNKNIKIIVEGNSNALKFDGKTLKDNWDLSSKQASSVVRMLQKVYKVKPKRMMVTGRSEYATEKIETVTRILIDPEFDAFYSEIKETMKEMMKK